MMAGGLSIRPPGFEGRGRAWRASHGLNIAVPSEGGHKAQNTIGVKGT